MATTYKILGQLAPTSTVSPSAVYTVPSSTSAVVSTISICNRATSSATYSLAVVANGQNGTLNDIYITFDAPIGANETIFLTVGMTLASGDAIYIVPSTANLTVNMFGSEIS